MVVNTNIIENKVLVDWGGIERLKTKCAKNKSKHVKPGKFNTFNANVSELLATIAELNNLTT
ncbi:hypothetical protein FF38_03898 [Lucilia cuprina]|uniref:Uncharacterized protein n=1 Tax=Lucilia cuprina TaxID=7375 RepID=A0A0L0CLA8_LUCCU|nr:hypothetical protein FF38_03898 [Lucilia cuprina]